MLFFLLVPKCTPGHKIVPHHFLEFFIVLTLCKLFWVNSLCMMSALHILQISWVFSGDNLKEWIYYLKPICALGACLWALFSNKDGLNRYEKWPPGRIVLNDRSSIGRLFRELIGFGRTHSKDSFHCLRESSLYVHWTDVIWEAFKMKTNGSEELTSSSGSLNSQIY